jgi:clan AA aspartic protease
MGFVELPIRIAHPLDESRSVIIDEALFDTGATIGSVPRRIAEQLGLPIIAQRGARTVEGNIRMDVARALLTIGGEETIQEIFVSDTLDRVLVGVVPLETLGFAVDPVNNRLVPVELLML